MVERYHLGLSDYGVIVLSLAMSLGIGILFHFTEKQKSSRDFMLAGSNMSRIPVTLSIVVTFISAIMMIGAPAEIYRYGSQLMVLIIGQLIGVTLAAYLLLPIYFNLGICSVYEYLEMRFGRLTRFVVSGLFVLQMIMYMSVVLHAPAIALSAVTDLTTETSIMVMGIVCIVYCALGGLKAVLWTDAFQSALMYACLITVFTTGIMESGGVSEVIYRAKEGYRWEFFNFNIDLTTRYTVWNALIRGFIFGIGGYGVSQLEIQRLFSINNIQKAQSALLWSILPMVGIIFMSYSMGLILYSVFYGCDPLLNTERTGLTKHDQLLPYFIVTRMSEVPGLTGLCIAGIFSSSLSTISSAVNSISTVTVVDFVQPYCSCLNLKDSQVVWIVKGLVIIYGFLCIGFTFLLSQIGSLNQMATVALGVGEGPVLAVFLLGVLTVKTNQKGSAIGFLAGCLLSGWVGYGSVFSGYIDPPLPLSTENCSIYGDNSSVNFESFEIISTKNETLQNPSLYQQNVFFLYRISYMWIPAIGFVCTASVSYLASIFMSWNKKNKVDANFLSPFVKIWMDNSAFENDEMNLEERNRITLPDGSHQSIKRTTISNCKL